MDEWNKLNNFLKKFQNIIPHEKTKKRVVQEVIQSVTKINIKEDELSVGGSIVFLNTSSVQKNQILLYREQIVSKIQNTYPKLEIRDIK